MNIKRIDKGVGGAHKILGIATLQVYFEINSRKII
jgi:hypothetical protein